MLASFRMLAKPTSAGSLTEAYGRPSGRPYERHVSACRLSRQARPIGGTSESPTAAIEWRRRSPPAAVKTRRATLGPARRAINISPARRTHQKKGRERERRRARRRTIPPSWKMDGPREYSYADEYLSEAPLEKLASSLHLSIIRRPGERVGP